MRGKTYGWTEDRDGRLRSFYVQRNYTAEQVAGKLGTSCYHVRKRIGQLGLKQMTRREAYLPEILRMYKAGDKPMSIAHELGMSETFVRKALISAGQRPNRLKQRIGEPTLLMSGAIPVAAHKALRTEARQRNMSLGMLLREIVAKYLEGKGETV